MLTKSLFINIFIFRLNRHRQFTPLSFQRLCFSVCLFPINVRTAEPIVPKFCVGPHLCPQGRLMIDRNFKISLLTKFNFHKIFKIHETFVWNLRTFFVIVLQCTQRENVYNWNRVWAQSALKAIYSNLIFKLSSPETESETALQWSTSFFFSFITYSCFSLKSWVGTDYWSQSWILLITYKVTTYVYPREDGHLLICLTSGRYVK